MPKPDNGHEPDPDELLSEADAYFARLSDQLLPELSRAVLAERDSPLQNGTRLGSYRIVRELARGGMGVVYLAERADGEFERQVAIKVLRRGLDTDDIIERFMRERQILASLAHPSITALIDGGATPDGRPYFVMELDEGQRIDDYCDKHALTIRQRLELFLLVSDVVAHAHRHLIVHRDLKPSNITVSEQGTVRLLDFGIAKVLGPDASHRELTNTQSRLLTPAFASPEQLRGEAVTTLSDVYQLGLLLHLLLCGRLPGERDDTLMAALHGGVQRGLQSASLEFDPSSPSQRLGTNAQAKATASNRGVSVPKLERQLRGDLDAIVLKALRPDPLSRYSSVADLAADVQRHLDGLPVLALHGSTLYNGRRFASRHRVALIAGFAAVVTLGMYGAGIARARNEARTEATRAQQVTELLVDILSGADPDVAMGDTLTVREALDRGIVRIQERLHDQPEIEADLLSAAGRVYSKLGLFEESEPLLERAVSLRDAQDTASVADLRYLALARVRTDTEAGVATMRVALDRAERLLSPDDPALAGLLVSVGYHLSKEERKPMLQRALRILRASDEDVRAELAQALTVQAYSVDSMPLSEALHREALAMRIELHGGEHITIATSMADLALMLENIDAKATDSLHEASIAMLTRLLGRDHTLTLQVMGNHSAVLRDRGEYAAAEVVAREVVSRLRASYPEETLRNAHQELNLGRVLAEQGKHDEAEELLRYVVELYAGAFDESNPRLVGARSALARCEELQGSD